ncbi:chemotaxis protein CheW [Caballeronia fortuita]|uniref:Chemotaxis protein CheW n=1 Tax=Caballeronia fortuita TaxID=1777138 RepID=A0A158D5D2_9BURK|nr:chemotaxis protein CheW [Caballeronia fortuita]SAK89789.1 chemotaxis protein CheW [Caballeronia fortuita]
MNARDIDDCWNRIGVRGDASCPKLARYVHCRNCPVHEAAAARVLDRVEGRTSIVASTNADKSNADNEAISCLVFRIGGEWLGLPTAFCAQVAQLRPVHSLPHRRNRAVLGVVNVRGRLIVCVSLARLFGIETNEGAAKNVSLDARELGRLIVMQCGNGEHEAPVAFPVDAVDGVHRFTPAQLQPVPATLAQRLSSHAHAVAAFKAATAGLLDADRLIDSLNRSLT